MTDTDLLRALKSHAKFFARANRIPLHKALDQVASKLGFHHWVSAKKALAEGWRPSQEQMAAAEELVKAAVVSRRKPTSEEAILTLGEIGSSPKEGSIGPHQYTIEISFGDVHMFGKGWAIYIDEAPSASPIVQITNNRINPNPINDPMFLDEALEIARENVKKARAEISLDWPRRSTKPDASGRIRHPLFGGLKNEWYCLHCDRNLNSDELAENMWHCPSCNATPIDIYPAPFWRCSVASREPTLPATPAHAGPTQSQASSSEAVIEVVDATPKIDLNPLNVEVLLRSALIEDASNVGERMAAILAHIGVDEDNDVYIILDVDLWSEDKDPLKAMEVAENLGLDLDVSGTCMTFPFHWPALVEVAENTPEYVKLLIEAYGETKKDQSD